MHAGTMHDGPTVTLGRVQELQELCTPGSSNCKLTHLFLYVVDPAQKVRPPDIPQAQWEAALQRAGGADNRSGLWPVPVRGMHELKVHHDSQQAALQGNRSFLADLQGLVQRLSQWDEAALRRRAQAIMDHHSHLSLRLLKVPPRHLVRSLHTPAPCHPVGLLIPCGHAVALIWSACAAEAPPGPGAWQTAPPVPLCRRGTYAVAAGCVANESLQSRGVSVEAADGCERCR